MQFEPDGKRLLGSTRGMNNQTLQHSQMDNTIQSSNYGGKSGRRLVKNNMTTTIDSTASLTKKSF